MKSIIKVIIFTLLYFQFTKSAKILFLFGGGNYSHKLAVWPLVIALTEKGHSVTFVSSSDKQPKPNSKVIDITPVFMKKVTSGVYDVDRFQQRKNNEETIFSKYENDAINLCNLTLNSKEDPQWTRLLQNEKFDLVVTNAVYGECAIFLSHQIGIKHIIFDTSAIMEWWFGTFGLQFESSWMPYSARILFLFGGGNYSHKLAVWPLVMALTENGHSVTFVSSSPKQPKANSRVTDITPSFMNKLSSDFYNVDRFKDRIENTDNLFVTYEKISIALCNLTLNSKDDPEWNNLLEDKNFDLIVANAVFGEWGLVLTKHFGVKYIIFDTTTIHAWYYGAFGLQLEPWIPDFMSHVEYPMNIWDRLKVFYYKFRWYRHSAEFENTIKQLYIERFGLENAPEFIDLERNSSLILVNTHFSMDFPRSLPPIFVHVGGMQCWEPEGVLPQNFKDFMDGAEDGVILISFGSTIQFDTLSKYHLDIFYNMMRKFNKVRFIWRWDGPIPEYAPKNLLSSKWLPQREILREKSVRAIMSHGGISSMSEATYYGVPVISMPLFADQDYQAYRVVSQGVGVKVEAATFSQESLDEAILKILSNPEYKKNMEIRSKLFRDRPNPTETAVSSIEYVLRNDDLTPLKPMELEQTFWVRQHVDIYAIAFVIFTLVNIIIPYTVFRILRSFFGK